MKEIPASCLVTDDELTEMGFPVKKWDKVVGCMMVTRKGTSRSTAIKKAIKAGKVVSQLIPTPKQRAERLRKMEAANPSTTVDPEMFEFFMSIKRGE